MARETKTVQCYPDDAIINERIKRYEAFGWELINNQRCQEYEGQTSSHDFINGGTTVTRHYSTFNKLTFSRDKNTSWYREVVKLESDYESIMNREPDRPANTRATWVRWLIVFIILALSTQPAFVFGGSIGIGIGVAMWAISLLIIIFGIKKNIDYKRKEGYYYSKLNDWRTNEKPKADALMKKAAELVG